MKILSGYQKSLKDDVFPLQLPFPMDEYIESHYRILADPQHDSDHRMMTPLDSQRSDLDKIHLPSR